MHPHTFLITAFISAICLAQTTCSNHAADKSHPNLSATDSLTAQKDALAKIYTQCISEFIKAAYKKDKIVFDTLFFGKHVYGQPDDFPDIELPETIENTPVRLVTPADGQKKQQERKSLVYVNMMGWIEQEKADFILVVFSNGGAHQYDYFIHFRYNATRKDFELEKIETENYIQSHGQKPDRITIYKDRKYVGDK